MRALLIAILATSLAAQTGGRYAELMHVIDRNTGFAHGTRGVNMYTLFALRTCVSDGDIPVLNQILSSKDRISRVAAASVLADLGRAGQDTVRTKLSIAKDAGERMMLQEAIDTAQKADYRGILQYPMTPEERSRIKGCK